MFNKVNNVSSVKPPANLWNNSKTNKNEKSNEGFKIDKFEAPKVKQPSPLSAAAQSLLDDLKKKFGNVYFIVENFSSDGEAQRHLSRGKGEINCIITPDLLEKMANCDETRAKYEGLIEESIGGLAEMKETIGEEKADMIKSYGISVDSDGNVNYSVLLNDSLKGLNDGSRVVKANSIEELMKKLDEIDEERRAEAAREKQKEKFNIEV